MTDFDVALQSFFDLSSEAIGHLSGTIALIQEGLAPSTDRSNETAKLLFSLRESYEVVRDLARESIGDSAVSEDEPVQRYKDQLDELRATMINQQVEKAKSLIESFLRVRSDEQVFANALKPAQDEARLTLSVLSGGISEAVGDDGELSVDISTPSLFMEAMRHDDDLTLLEQVSNTISFQVSAGLMRGRYYLDDATTTEGDAPEMKPLAAVDNDGGPNSSLEEAMVQEIPIQSKSERDRISEEELPVDAPEPEPSPEAPIPPVRPVKATAKLGVKSLENKFLSRLGRATHDTSYVIAILMRFGACTTGQVLSLYYMLTGESDSITAEDVRQCIAGMEKANIACTFSIDGEDVYCMTVAGRRTLMKDTIRNHGVAQGKPFWPLLFEEHECSAGATMLPSVLRAVVAENDSLLEHYGKIKEEKGLRTASGVMKSTHRSNGAYVIDGEGRSFSSADATAPDDDDTESEIENPFESEGPAAKAGTSKKGPDAGEEADGDFQGAVALTPDDKSEVAETGETGSSGGEHVEKTGCGESGASRDDAEEQLDVMSEEQPVEEAASQEGVGDMTSEAAWLEGDDHLGKAADNGARATVDSCAEDESDIWDCTRRAEAYVDGAGSPSDHELANLAMEIIDEVDVSAGLEADLSNIACAWTLLKSVAGTDGYDECSALMKQLSLAVGPVTDDTLYTSSSLFGAFGRSETFDESLMLAACLNAMSMPHWGQNDQALWSQCKYYLDGYDLYFPSYDVAKPLYRTLYGLHDITGEGFSGKVIALINEGKSHQAMAAEVKGRALALSSPRHFSAYHPGVPKLSQECFGDQSILGKAMRMICGKVPLEKGYLNEVCEMFCDEGGGPRAIAGKKVEDHLDDLWHGIIAELDGNKRGKPDRLKYSTRSQAISACKERLEVVIDWLDLADERIDPEQVAKLRDVRHDVLTMIDDMALSGVLAGRRRSAIVLCSIVNLSCRLRGERRRPLDFTGFLTSGYVSLDEDLIPVANTDLNSVRYAEPWRQVLRHFVAEPFSLTEAAAKVLERDNPMSDNLVQLAHIKALLGETESDKITEKRAEQAEADASAKLERFQNELEVNVLYNRITDDDKEEIDSCWRAYKDYYYGLGDFGLWAQFLDALNCQIRDLAEEQHITLSNQLERRFSQLTYGEDTSLLDVTRRLLEEDRNYATVEEYINLFDEGERTFSDRIDQMSSVGEISDFLDDEVNDALYERCVQRSRTSPSFLAASRAVMKDYERDGVDLPAESDTFFINWPDDNLAGYDKASIGIMLRKFGFDVRGPKPVRSDSLSIHYVIGLTPSPMGKRDYPHPISMFGTLADSKLHVLVLSSRVTPKDIFNRVEALNNQGMTLVISNRAIGLSERRKMAETCHVEKSGLTPFICIDRVLALHLAMVDLGARFPELLRCTLPFTHCQPFIRENGSTSDEMFFGRKKELRSILDPSGATFVYGGRQLGKSALLERAEHFFGNGQDKHIAVLCKIDDVTTDEGLVEAISDALFDKGLKLGRKFTGIDEMCRQIERALGDGRVKRVLVLIDEADTYLDAISANNYTNLRPMVDLWRSTQGNFKFVMAGLHNVSRAKNATEKNGIFGQLGEAQVIRPLERQDALQLIARPLSYLGYRIDEYPYLMTILTKTNYYPGILQFFGYTLVESISEHYGHYYRAVDGNPPYALDPAQLGAILNKSELRESIKKKFRLSLELSDRYQAIARVFALLYRDCEDRDENIRERDGFSVAEVWKWVDDLSIPQLAGEDIDSFKVLLDEMCDMNILFKGNDDTPLYRLRHYDFLRIIGGRDVNEILGDLVGE